MADHGATGQTAATAAGSEHAGETRRDFLHIAAASLAAGGVAAVAWPFIQQLAPNADTRALSSAEFDVSKVPEGGEARILIGGKPFFIRHRTAKEIEDAEKTPMSDLKDPETDDARLVVGVDGKKHPEYLITSGTCTHLGCVPVGPAQGNVGEFGGWFCPCHGSQYDTSGRIRKGPAPKNLAVPKYTYSSATVVKISL